MEEDWAVIKDEEEEEEDWAVIKAEEEEEAVVGLAVEVAVVDTEEAGEDKAEVVSGATFADQRLFK